VCRPAPAPVSFHFTPSGRAFPYENVAVEGARHCTRGHLRFPEFFVPVLGEEWALISFVEPAFRRKGILDQSSKHGITNDKFSMANSQFKPGVTPQRLSGLKIGN
jgi:hypothetical protein